VAGVVIPAGYSFNLNGTAIYLTLALMFLAQALRLELSLTQQLTILAVAMVTSKGASGVAGSAFIALAATLAAVPEIPDASLVFIIGIERLLKCRSLTNIIGNGVACIAISAWSGELDRGKLHALLQGKCD
jgi:aerobic C4-dicarboxylate transport protein